MPALFVIPLLAGGGGLIAGLSLSDGIGQLIKLVLILVAAFIGAKVTGVL